MKQNMKRVLLVLCMTACLFALSACSKTNDAASEKIDDSIVRTMNSGAENYLNTFDSYDDEKIESEKKRVEKQGNTVMATALDSWKLVKADLGKKAGGKEAILSSDVVCLEEGVYEVEMRVSYEKREMVFNLTAEETIQDGRTVLTPTSMVFNPVYTTGEKLTKAGMNTLMGMGTVFIVLIFMSFVISGFKGINSWEANMKANKEAKEREAAKAAAVKTPETAPAPVPVLPVVEAPAPVLEPEIPAAEENLVDDMELAAVITAAIAACQSVPAEGLVVRSIRRKSASKWKNA